LDLFGHIEPAVTNATALDGVRLLKALALPQEAALLADVERVLAAAPLRHMVTPGGFAMSVAMSNCGELGWVTERHGYRYDGWDPLTQQAWPLMPASFAVLSQQAATLAGYPDFVADACLINRYQVGARMGLHQDKNERDFSQPIVSVSLGLTATFQFGGFKRSDKALSFPLYHGDVVVWGGAARLRYHGVLPLKAGMHPALGESRINLTFRKAG